MTKRDFHSKMSIASKEARETIYWLRLFKTADLINEELANELIGECEEISRILISIVKTTFESLK